MTLSYEEHFKKTFETREERTRELVDEVQAMITILHFFLLLRHDSNVCVLINL